MEERASSGHGPPAPAGLRLSPARKVLQGLVSPLDLRETRKTGRGSHQGLFVDQPHAIHSSSSRAARVRGRGLRRRSIAPSPTTVSRNGCDRDASRRPSVGQGPSLCNSVAKSLTVRRGAGMTLRVRRSRAEPLQAEGFAESHGPNPDRRGEMPARASRTGGRARRISPRRRSDASSVERCPVAVKAAMTVAWAGGRPCRVSPGVGSS